MLKQRKAEDPMGEGNIKGRNHLPRSQESDLGAKGTA